jgi:large subunit ribosomal protein L21
VGVKAKSKSIKEERKRGSQMHAIVEIGGFQFRVSENDVLKVPKMNLEPGQKTKLDKVLFLSDGTDAMIGNPVVKKAYATAEIVSHGRGKKIVVSTYKRRKDERKKRGHRQDYTELRILSLSKA